MATGKVSRMTVRVVASVLVQERVSANGAKVKEWGPTTKISGFELVTKEMNQSAGLKRAIGKFNRADMVMVDENTVVVTPANKQNDALHVRLVYSVLRYSSQCPECGAMPNKPNEWCELCIAQQAANQTATFDPIKSLDALLGLKVDDSGDDEE